MRFRNKENELMWERYTGHSYAQDPHADNSGEQQQQQKFNRQNGQPPRNPRAFDYSDRTTQPDSSTYFSNDNLDHGAGGVESPDLYDTNYSEEEAETVVLGLEPEGELEVDDSFDLVPDTDDSDGFGDMMEEDEPEDEIDEVLYSDIKKLAEYSNRLLKDVDHSELETWMIAKIIKASEYVSDVWHRLDAKTDFANTGVDQTEDDEFGM